MIPATPFLIGLAACLAALGGIAAWRLLRNAASAQTRGTFAALAALAIACTIFGQKPSPDTPTITVDALLRDVGCYATNNVFHAAVTNAPSYAGVDFSDCDLMVYARERASSDAASWFELTPRKKFSQQPADYAIENATNYNYMVYLNYVPPSPVHTNGVFELHGFMVPGDDPGNLEQIAAGFINSRALLDVPYDSEVEYLESIDRQFIRTGVLFDALTDVIECEFAIVEAKQYGTVFGANSRASDTELRFTFRQNGVTGTWQTQGCTFQSSVPYTAGGFYKIRVASQANGGSFINGTSGYLSAPEVYRFAGNVLYIFAVNDFTGQANWFSAARLYGFKITRSGIPICDYIPVRKGSIGYLYDRASGQLFGNAGQGKFRYGNDIKPTTWVDGEYWNTYGNGTAVSGGSRCENFIPVQPSSTVTFYLGYRPGGTTLYMVQYNAEKVRVNSTYNANGGARTATIPSNCHYIRISCETVRMGSVYIHDDTNDIYLMRSGKEIKH